MVSCGLGVPVWQLPGGLPLEVGDRHLQVVLPAVARHLARHLHGRDGVDKVDAGQNARHHFLARVPDALAEKRQHAPVTGGGQRVHGAQALGVVAPDEVGDLGHGLRHFRHNVRQALHPPTLAISCTYRGKCRRESAWRRAVLPSPGWPAIGRLRGRACVALEWCGRITSSRQRAGRRRHARA